MMQRLQARNTQINNTMHKLRTRAQDNCFSAKLESAEYEHWTQMSNIRRIDHILRTSGAQITNTWSTDSKQEAQVRNTRSTEYEHDAPSMDIWSTEREYKTQIAQTWSTDYEHESHSMSSQNHKVRTLKRRVQVQKHRLGTWSTDYEHEAWEYKHLEHRMQTLKHRVRTTECDNWPSLRERIYATPASYCEIESMQHCKIWATFTKSSA